MSTVSSDRDNQSSSGICRRQPSFLLPEDDDDHHQQHHHHHHQNPVAIGRSFTFEDDAAAILENSKEHAAAVTQEQHARGDNEEDEFAGLEPSEAQRLRVQRAVESFEPEPISTQLLNMRQHFLSVGAEYDRLHLFNQATQLLPPTTRGLVPKPFSAASPARSVAQTIELASPMRDRSQQAATSAPLVEICSSSSIIISQQSGPPSPSPSPVRQLLDNSDFRYGLSPLRNQTYNVEYRRQYDLWLQQDNEFTRVCFYRLEDAHRARIRQEHRESFDQAVKITTELKMSELCQMEAAFRHTDIRCAFWRGWFELVALQEMGALVIERKEWLLLLVGAKLYLRVWPECVAAAQQVVDEESEAFVPLVLEERSDVIRLRKGPLYRFWIVKDSALVQEARQEEREREQLLLSGGGSSDAMNSSRAHVVVGSSSRSNDSLAAVSARVLRDFKSARDVEAVYSRDQHRIAAQTERYAVFTAESKKRNALILTATREWLSIVNGIFEAHETICRAVAADRLLRQLIAVRRRCSSEQPLAQIVADETRMRRKWQVVEELTRKDIIQPAEHTAWRHLLYSDRLTHRFVAFAQGRKAQQQLLLQAARIVKLFVVQRRQVQRVMNMRRNVARFMQRCGRGYLVRLQACKDRLHMLRCKAHALYRLKCKLSLLVGSHFLRARLSRAEVVMHQRAQLLCQWLQCRRSSILCNKTYNRTLAPRAADLIAHVAGKFSELLVSHRRRNAASCLLARALSALCRRRHTQRLVIARDLMLSALFSRIAHNELLQRSASFTQRFARAASSTRRVVNVAALRRLRAACLLQRVGRSSLSRSFESRPAHLYTVQEQIFAFNAISRWWLRQKEQRRTGNLVDFRFRALRLFADSSAEAHLDVLVPHTAATTLGKWWRMMMQRRRYCAWRISDFFARHKLRAQIVHLRALYARQRSATTTSGPDNKSRVDKMRLKRQLLLQSRMNRSGVVIVGEDASVSVTSISATVAATSSSPSSSHALSARSRVFVVGAGSDIEDDDSDAPLECSGGRLATFAAAQDDEADDVDLFSTLLAADVADALEASAVDAFASLIEEFAVSIRKLQLTAKCSWLDARDRQHRREQQSILRAESALRHRIVRRHIEWRVAMLRLNELGGGVNYFFIPFEFDAQEDSEVEVGYFPVAAPLHLESTSARVLLPSEKTRFEKRRCRYMDALTPQERAVFEQLDRRRNGISADGSATGDDVRRITAGAAWHRENKELEVWKLEQRIEILKAQVLEEVERSKALLNKNKNSSSDIAVLGELPQYIIDHFGLDNIVNNNAGNALSEDSKLFASLLKEEEEEERQQQQRRLAATNSDTSQQKPYPDGSNGGSSRRNSSRRNSSSAAMSVVASVSDRLKERRRSNCVMVGIDPVTGSVTTRTILLPTDLDFHVKARLEELQETMELHRMRAGLERRKSIDQSRGETAAAEDIPARYELFKPSSSPQRRNNKSTSGSCNNSNRRPLSALTLLHDEYSSRASSINNSVQQTSSSISVPSGGGGDAERLLPPKEWLLQRRKTLVQKSPDCVAAPDAVSSSAASQRRPSSATLVSTTTTINDAMILAQPLSPSRRNLAYSRVISGKSHYHRILSSVAAPHDNIGDNNSNSKMDADATILRELNRQRPFDKNVAAWAPQPEYRAVTDKDYIPVTRLHANRLASSPAKQAERRRLLAQLEYEEEQLRLQQQQQQSDGSDAERVRGSWAATAPSCHLVEQLRPELLRPPAGKHFDAFDGRFDVCRWWGSRIGPSAAGAPRVSQFGSASLTELCDELAQSSPVEVLAMASPWFPLNGGAIGAIVEATLVLNKKHLKAVAVANEDDRLFVGRLLRREGLEKVKIVIE